MTTAAIPTWTFRRNPNSRLGGADFSTVAAPPIFFGFPMLSPSDHWGPFSPAISHPERVARLRALRMAVQTLVRDGAALEDALLIAESGEAADLQAAMRELDRLPALTRRNVEGSYIRHQTRKPKGGRPPPRQLEGGG